MTDQMSPPSPPRPDRERPGPYLRIEKPPWYVAAVTALLVAIIALLIIVLVRDDGTQVQTVAPTTIDPVPTLPAPSTDTSDTAATSTSTTVGSTTSSAATTTTVSSTTTVPSTTTTIATTTIPPTTVPDWVDSAVWPWYDSAVRYDDPVDVARGFATDFAGFDDPIVGVFRQGDAQSGEVEVRADGPGPVTTVLVRRLGPDGDWWVIGAVTDNLWIDEPEVLDEVTSPLTVQGRVLAFEGRAQLQLRAAGSTAALHEGYVTGGGDRLREFETEFTFAEPDGGGGALLLRTFSMDDGAVQQVAVLRILFAG